MNFEIVGWLGVALGLMVAPPQLYRILKTKQTQGISRATYWFLVPALMCYLAYSIYIRDAVYITAQTINTAFNLAVLVILIKEDTHGRV